MTPGDTVNQYEITRLLGEGGGGRVHVAIDTLLQREVAIKSLRPELLGDAQFTERFVSEAKNLAALNHPNITTLYALQRHGDHLLMIMELVRGRTLESILEERGGAMSVREALAIIVQAADGLAFAHESGVVHRDIKPSNLMVSANGRVKLMDFGIARASGADRLTRAGSIIGTPMYMSPEQCKGAPGDPRSDLYSLAIVFYELLSGAPPFAGATDYELIEAQIKTIPSPLIPRVPGVSASLESAIFKALAKKPEQRFQTMREFSEAIGGATLLADATAIVAAYETGASGIETREMTTTSLPGRISTVAQSRASAAGRRFRAWSPLGQGASATAAALVAAMVGFGVYSLFDNAPTVAPPARVASPPATAPPLPAQTVATPQSAAPLEPAKPPPAAAAMPNGARTDCVGENCQGQLENRVAKTPTFPPQVDVQPAKVVDMAPAPAIEAPARPPEIVGTPQVIDTGTLNVTGKRIELEGVEGVRGKLAEHLVAFIREQGGRVVCQPRAAKYRCFVGDGRTDLSMAVLKNGAGRASSDASQDLLNLEHDARNGKVGLWATNSLSGSKLRKTK